MRLAIFGGTFDPVHNAHLAIARAAADRLSLDRVLFVPAAHPPHKRGITHAPFEHRLRMVELAVVADPRFEASRIEEFTSRSYSIDTIERVRATLNSEDQLYFLIGDLLKRLVYLSYGLAVLLAFIGVKLIFHAMHENELPFINGGEPIPWAPEIPIWLSLLAIVGILGVTTVLSLMKDARDRKAAASTGETS